MMEATPRIHATVNKALYAIPVSLSVTLMKVNTTTIKELRKQNKYRDLKLPPPIEDWGDIDLWNMTMFNHYLDIMWQEGYRNLFALPTWWRADTEWAVISGIFYGATVLNAAGRCGLDGAYETMLNETFMKWIERPGLLSERIASNQTAFEIWKAAPKKDDPVDEPGFTYWELIWVDDHASQEGFQFEAGYGAFQLMYPPTEVTKAWGNFAGIPPTSRHATLAYDALMEVIARNDRLHVNLIGNYNGGQGTSAWKAAKNSPEYKVLLRRW
ncbi:hypothetical protein HK097_007015 [Rhizophlyctis rosea]|uniref:Uncharacterized protein n=1 Tax=Rhizophlyctis rosea TaxID=64517 RepID=A0AAD5SK32_9FUNG|nr:hypothetical protein HK097_007015 [Rhizophlyctis rosea]